MSQPAKPEPRAPLFNVPTPGVASAKPLPTPPPPPSSNTPGLVILGTGVAVLGTTGGIAYLSRTDPAFNAKLHKTVPDIAAIFGAPLPLPGVDVNKTVKAKTPTRSSQMPTSVAVQSHAVEQQAPAPLATSLPMASSAVASPSESAPSTETAEAAAKPKAESAVVAVAEPAAAEPPAPAEPAAEPAAAKPEPAAVAELAAVPHSGPNFDAEMEALLRTPDDSLPLELRLVKKDEQVRRAQAQLFALQTVIEQQALAAEERTRERVGDAIRRKEEIDARAFDEVVRLQESKHKLELEEARAVLAADHARAIAAKEEVLAELRGERDRIAAEKADEAARLAQSTALWEVELAEQRLVMEKGFAREREDRLARLGAIETKLATVEAAAEGLADYKRYSAFVHELSGATMALVQTANTSQPFGAQLAALRQVAIANNEAALVVILDNVPSSVAAAGLPSHKYLAERFDAMRVRARRVALVPFNGSITAHALSALYAAITFPKEGLVAGTDVDAVLARARYWVVKEDLGRAVAELESLPEHEWAARLAGSWVAAAKDRMRAELALQVVQAEVATRAANLRA